MIRRPWLVAAVFVLSALVLGGALAWVTRLTLELERSEVAALERAVYEENVRIALWRMDAALAAFIARENARPGGSFIEAGGQRTDSGEEPAAEEAGPESGSRDGPLVRARFAVGADRELRSEPGLPAPEWVASLEIPAARPVPRQEPVRTAVVATPDPAPASETAAVEVLAQAPAEPSAWSDPQVSPEPGQGEETLERTALPSQGHPESGKAESGLQSAYTQEQLNVVGFEQRQQLGAQSSFFVAPPELRVEDAAPGEEPEAGGAGGPPAQADTEPGPPPAEAGVPASAQADEPGSAQADEPDSIQVSEPATTADAGETAGGTGAEESAYPERIDVAAGSRAAATEPQSAAQASAATHHPAAVPGATTQEGDSSEAPGAVPEHSPPIATVPGAPAEPPGAPASRPSTSGATSRARSANEPVVVESAFTPRWMGDDLVLLRRVHRGPDGLLQGLWLDWDAVQGWLLGQVRDLLPAGELRPSEGHPDPGRSLALLPARLEPGPMPAVVKPDWTPVRWTLAAAWGAVLLAILGVGALLVGTVRLSQRRADFASAVTHELRTPLTTFRLYSEMLRDGMVAAEDREDYLETLSAEAGRLEHLVTNVLAFSRLEQGSAGSTAPATLPLGELLEPIVPRLRERAARGGLELESGPEATGLARVPVLADPAGVEQILANLVDNACKYAAGSRPPVLHLEVEERGPTVAITVRDHGPGVGSQERRRLFRPFHKPAHQAAESAPGVGLGLALSRRLARQMGGSLRLARSPGGAAFELGLRRGDAGGRGGPPEVGDGGTGPQA